MDIFGDFLTVAQSKYNIDYETMEDLITQISNLYEYLDENKGQPSNDIIKTLEGLFKKK